MRDAVTIEHYGAREPHPLGWCAEALTIAVGSSDHAGQAVDRPARWLLDPSDDERLLAAMLRNTAGPVLVQGTRDLFDDAVTDRELLKLFRIMDLARWRVFQVVTSRARRLAAFTRRLYHRGGVLHLADEPLPLGTDADLESLWLGVRVSDEVSARMWIRHLLAVKCGVRFVLAEPLVAPVDMAPYLRAGIDWVIVGGEIEPDWRFRRMHMDWACSIRDACVEAGRPLYFTQRSGRWVTENSQLLDGKPWRELPRRETDQRTKKSLRQIRERLRAVDLADSRSILPLL